MTRAKSIPSAAYGILQQSDSERPADPVEEEIRALGYSVLDSGFDSAQLSRIATEFDRTRSQYLASHGEDKLRELNEINTIRSPLLHGGKAFLELALNETLLALVGRLIRGKFILNQQNGIVNPPQQGYNQDAWHRDLPYQHFVSSRPLAVNALFCLDDFTIENGATFVLPASHKTEDFPSSRYIEDNAIQVEAPAGSFIMLDCMTFHAGGYNTTKEERRAVNHLFTIPFFKQQINLPANLEPGGLTEAAQSLLGFPYVESVSVADYLASRAK